MIMTMFSMRLLSLMLAEYHLHADSGRGHTVVNRKKSLVLLRTHLSSEKMKAPQVLCERTVIPNLLIW